MAGAPANLRKEVSQFVKDTMENTELGPLAMFKTAKQKMLATKTGRYQKIHPRLMLIHPKNRGCSGINIFNAHKNLMNIFKVGCDLDLLKQACACDMAPQGSQEHAIQVAVNQKWASASNGMMALVTGEERFISLAASHTYAAFRAADAGCKTPHKDIQDKSGAMDKALLSSDSN